LLISVNFLYSYLCYIMNNEIIYVRILAKEFSSFKHQSILWGN